MAERTCCATDVLVFGHVTCELGEPVRPPRVMQPSSAPPEPADDDAVMRAIYRNVPPPADLPPRPRRRRLLERITR